MEILTLRSLSFSYPQCSEKALDEIDLSVPQGAFLVLCGPSGSGKSTLLRQLKTDLTPHGNRTGEILFRGVPLEQLDRRVQSREIGFVSQSPEDQIVTDRVWHELAFGLESLGTDTPSIRRRVSEMASFFGIQAWFDRNTADLSGGQKQLLNLAAVMVTQPSLLILDEPTSQLDPIAASEFLSMLGKLNRELGTTIMLSEHRLEEAFPIATYAAVLDAGRIFSQGTPQSVGTGLRESGHCMFESMPVPMRVWASVKFGEEPPVTIGEGRTWLEAFAAERPLLPLPETQKAVSGETVLQVKDLWFRYERNGADVVQGLSLTVQKGEFLALLGGNGTGKTTALRLLAGYARPYRGTVTAKGSIAMLPQSPRAVFVRKTVLEDLLDVTADREFFETVIAICRLEYLLHRHPYDLSGGEQQRAALAKILLSDPDILLLDEPTKGLDPDFKESLGEILQDLCDRRKTVVAVSHDLEFCAQYAHRCALLFQGSITAEGPPRDFFSGNSFYTTSANRMARTVLPEAVTAGDLIAACGGEGRKQPERPLDSMAVRAPATCADAPVQRSKHRICTMVAATIILLLIPMTLYFGMHGLGSRKYTVVSLLVLLEAMLPFFILFEGRRPQARELAVIAVLCGIAVVGRSALFMLPQCKPVIAVAIVAGAALGGETGFLVGALSMLVSNLLFGQGPWTPWQMFAAGLTGFLAGVLFSRCSRKNRLALSLFGGAASVLLYGVIMNTSSALLWADPPTWPILLTYYAAGFPMDCIQGGATFVFLWFAAEPMLEKLERVKRKYGLIS